MRRARAVALGFVVAGVVAMALVAVLQRTSLAFTLGVAPAIPAVPLRAGDQACQRPIEVPEDASFDRVSLAVGTYHRAGSPLRVAVRSPAGRTLASGRLAGGYPDVGVVPMHTIRLDRTVPATTRIAVCLRNAGPRRVALYGNADAAARTSTATRDRRPLHVDMTLVFERGPRSMIGEVPSMFSRAALFRFPWLGAWAYVVLAVALALGGTWLLIRAVTAAAPASRDVADR